jgi:hypothetical protein
MRTMQDPDLNRTVKDEEPAPFAIALCIIAVIIISIGFVSTDFLGLVVPSIAAVKNASWHLCELLLSLHLILTKLQCHP